MRVRGTGQRNRRCAVLSPFSSRSLFVLHDFVSVHSSLLLACWLPPHCSLPSPSPGPSSFFLQLPPLFRKYIKTPAVYIRSLSFGFSQFLRLDLVTLCRSFPQSDCPLFLVQSPSLSPSLSLSVGFWASLWIWTALVQRQLGRAVIRLTHFLPWFCSSHTLFVLTGKDL
eukprot:RCo008015